jgi:hypothetical protein
MEEREPAVLKKYAVKRANGDDSAGGSGVERFSKK